MKKLYRINEALTQLASELGVLDSFTGEEDEFDDVLDHLTYYVAQVFRVNE